MEKNPEDFTVHQAATWYARLHAPDCSDAERHAFEQWVQGDPARKQAFEAAARTASLVSRQSALDPRLRVLAEQALRPLPATAAKPVRWCGVGQIAAALLVGVGAIIFASLAYRETVLDNQSERYVNHAMTSQQYILEDGTVLHLDVGASVQAVINSYSRNIELDKGRAFFDVATDKNRPFAVSVAGTRVVALGTQFQVEVDPTQRMVSVTLEEGSVSVAAQADPRGWREILQPGQQMQIEKRLNKRTTRLVDPDAVTSWSHGLLVFDDMPLAKALEEFNRYASIKVRLGDSALAQEPIGGNFVAGGSSLEFVETLAAVLPLRSVRTGANEIVLFKIFEKSSS